MEGHQQVLGLCLLGLGVQPGSYRTFTLNDGGWLRDAKDHCDEFSDGLSVDWSRFVNEVVTLVENGKEE